MSVFYCKSHFKSIVKNDIHASNKYGTNNAWSKSCFKRPTFVHAYVSAN